MRYSEEKDKTKIYKQNYINEICDIIEKRQICAAASRREYIKDVFCDSERYREDLKKMLGWPLTEKRPSEAPRAISEKLSDEEGYSIYRVQIEVICGLRLTGLFFKVDENAPLVIALHGTLGTPEHISGFYGDTTNYNDIVERLIFSGVNVFAPQLLLWRDRYNVEFDRNAVDLKLRRVGSSIFAVEVYGIMRALDYFETAEHMSSFGMVGLSAGGIYTTYTAAIDTRIRSAITCSFFNKKDDMTSGSFTWQDSAYKFDDAEVACLVYPRKLAIEIGDEDELFDSNAGKELFEYLKELCSDVGTDWVNFRVFGGKHEFFRDDEPITRLVNDLKK